MQSVGEVFMQAATQARTQNRISVKTFNGYAGTWGKICRQRQAAADKRRQAATAERTAKAIQALADDLRAHAESA